MQALFAPAIGIMNRLRYTQKFLLIGVLLMLAISVLVNNLYTALNADINTARAELVGIKTIAPAQRVVQYMQQHRGMSAGVLSGNEAMKEGRAAKQKEVETALRATEAVMPAALTSGKLWKSIIDEWKQVAEEGLSWTSTENFARHTAMIDNVLNFMVEVADQTSLTVDPDIDSYYLIDTTLNKAPVALERLEQLRAKGTGALTKKQMFDQQKTEVTALMAELNGANKTLKLNLEKTANFNPGMKATLDAATTDFLESATQINQLIVDDLLLGIFSTAPKDFFALTTAAIDKGYKQIFDVMLPGVEELLNRRIDKLQRDLNLSIGLTILSLLGVAYFAIATYYAMMDSIKRLTETADTLAKGDLRPRIELKTRDELRLVGDSFNVMADAFSNLLRNVQASSGQVLAASRRMAESSSQITQSTESQSEAASSMAAAVEQMTVGIDHISKNAIDANTISNRAGDLSAEGGRIVSTVVEEIRLIADAVNDSANIIDQLGKQSDQISAIVNAIKEIADQTNLLALNAAIEAARAGESGRGFAVVADEVRQLAERTSKSTKEISTMISAIQSGTQNAVASMRGGVERVSQGVVLATEAGSAMTEIQGNSSQVVETVSDISTALREQTTASTEIARNVEHIAQMAEENNAAVSENAATARELERLSESLQTEIQRFKVS